MSAPPLFISSCSRRQLARRRPTRTALGVSPLVALLLLVLVLALVALAATATGLSGL